MKKDWKINEDLAKYTKYVGFEKLKLTPLTIKIVNLFSSFSTLFQTSGKHLSSHTFRIEGYLGKKLKITTFSPKKCAEEIPALLLFHGGGFVFKGMSNAYHLAKTYAKEANMKVFFVDYHLAPKFPYPAAVEDAYCALEYIYQHSQELMIDKERIAVSGDSAGGMISAILPHMSRDRLGPPIKFQMLIYPVIDSSVITSSMKEFNDSYVWNSKLTKEMWKLFLEKTKIEDQNYTTLLSSPSFKGVPQAYIEVHEYDCLRDEGLLYADLLKEHGIKVECNFVEGSFHGADIFFQTKFVKSLIEHRIEVLKNAFK